MMMMMMTIMTMIITTVVLEGAVAAEVMELEAAAVTVRVEVGIS